ncbi:PLP-dependent aminotransferase family protein [Agaribacterium haliotis]|uniref:MocR-like pyridoxine biosynthesis transcription factor PdxR n=1 Tax=Agaribacterium haliotis TaxID=2013869 RepID=UPI000BB54580|nr:PLP-dependent aminotransferase family protein [Agaribacterium haliotis]
MMGPVLDLLIELEGVPKGSLTAAISSQIKLAIVDGRLVEDLKMPSTRALADALSISRNTASAVYDELIAQAFLYTIPAKGTFVKKRAVLAVSERQENKQQRLGHYFKHHAQAAILPGGDTGQYDFRVGRPSMAYFPYADWRRVLGRAARQHRQLAYQSAPAQGLLELRQAVATHLSYSRAIACEAEQVIISGGAQHAFDLICKVLVQPGTRVAIETPGYPMAKHCFLMHGAELVELPVDEHGLCVQYIPEDVDLIYTTPSHQFPTGVALSEARRRQLLDFAERHQVSIIEDDYDCEFCLSAKPINALKSLDEQQNVIYVGTFSKSFLPDVRLAYCVAPDWLRAALAHAAFLSSWHQNTVSQMALADFMQQGLLLKHLRRMRKIYSARYQRLFNLLHERLSAYMQPLPAYAGVHLTAKLDKNIDAFDLAEALQQQGLLIHSLQHFQQEPSCLNALVFGYGDIELQQLDAAVDIIVSTLASWRH